MKTKKLRRALSHNVRTFVILNISQVILYNLNILTVNHGMVQQKYSDRIDNKFLSKTKVDISECIPVAYSSLITTMKIYQAISLSFHKMHHQFNINLLTSQIHDDDDDDDDSDNSSINNFSNTPSNISSGLTA